MKSTTLVPFSPSQLDGKGLKVGIVVARWHSGITKTLLDGAILGLTDCGVSESDVQVVHCPGSFEIPVVLKSMSLSGRFDGLIAIGVVIKGETAHFEYVAGPVSYAIQQIATESGLPIGFCVLTTDTEQQALDRAGGIHGNKGYESALSVVETVAGIRCVKNSLS